MSEIQFYMRDSRGDTGDNVMFWRKGGAGYGTNLDELEVYTLERAQKQHNSRSSDVPLLKSAVDALSIFAVDCQVLPSLSGVDENDQYVVQLNGRWNGNDIAFQMRGGGHTYNYSKAGVFSSAEVAELFPNSKANTAFPMQLTDKLARRTFQASNIDVRAMITKPGIKLIRPRKQKQTTGKCRSNCPTCGRLVWDYNPYESAYCAKHDNYWDRKEAQDKANRYLRLRA